MLVARVSGGLIAFNGVTGKQLWKTSGRVSSPAASGSRAVFNQGKTMRCVDIRSGKTIWEIKPSVTGQTLISGDTILSASGASMQTLSLTSGKTIWDNTKGKSKPRRRRGHSGIYIVGDTIWRGYRGDRLSLKTGEKLKSLGVKNLWSPQHHHRCYTNKATSNYIIGAMEGMEYLALNDDTHSRNNWVRGSCRLGIMPANGMTYVPTDQCYCSAGVKLLGFNALLGAKDPGPADPPEKRLEKGPAFANVLNSKSQIPNSKLKGPSI